MSLLVLPSEIDFNVSSFFLGISELSNKKLVDWMGTKSDSFVNNVINNGAQF